AMGPRRISMRAIAGAIISGALSISSAMVPTAVLGVAAYHALDQGLVSQLSGATHIYHDLKPAPAASIYDASATHPLLRAGMDEAGFIAPERLFSAWSAAGIQEQQATRLLLHLW